MVRLARFLFQTFGLAGAGLIFMLEGLGAPLPVEVPLWIVGARVASGESGYWAMVLLMWSTTVVGNAAGYLLGYYGGRPAVMKLLQWFRVKEESWHKAESWFRQHGMRLVVGTRWINWGFAQNMWLCGITQVPLARFFVVMLINDFIWAMAWTALSRSALVYFRRHSIRFLHASTFRLGMVAIVVVLVGVGVWWLVRWYKQRQFRASGE